MVRLFTPLSKSPKSTHGVHRATVSWALQLMVTIIETVCSKQGPFPTIRKLGRSIRNQILPVRFSVMTYDMLKLVHVVGAVLIGAGLVGVWGSDMRSRQVRDLTAS